MIGHPLTSDGTTWRVPRGVTWVLGILLAFALAAAATAPVGQPTDISPVGLLTPKMVYTLDNDASASQPVPLSTVRDEVLNGYYRGDGSGIDIALIDTGVAPVVGLTGDKVLHGPDLSGEGSIPEVAFLDTYGHGTHMAGIMAGDRPGHEGVAPGARIISVKVAGADGVTTVPQVVAAIDWVVDHRNTDGLNIRVLNLSLGQSGVETHINDDLSMAVERAWQAGIFVVVAGGNSGDEYRHLDSPAIDPYVVAVGASDTYSGQRSSQDVPAWSAHGDGNRNPDLVAPGRSVASYRVPGSTIDTAYPNARWGDSFFLGSGSSQAAAALSGAAAVILGDNPFLDPDDLKASLKSQATTLTHEPVFTAGDGLVDAKMTVKKLVKDEQQHTLANGEPYTGTVGPTGATWSGGTWSGGTWSGATWSGTTWSGGTWSGATWSGATWSGATWSGATWSGGTWSGATWSGGTWSGGTWSGATWSGDGWE